MNHVDRAFEKNLPSESARALLVEVFCPSQIKWSDAERAKNERFARVMSGGMRDYEGWEEVRAFKTVRKSNAGASPRHRRDAARWRGGAGPTHELIFAQPGVLPLPPRAASSAFTSATMRAMAASSAAVVILAARALAMLSLARAAPRRALAKQSCQRNEPDRFSTHHPGELSGGPHPIYLHLLEAWF